MKTLILNLFTLLVFSFSGLCQTFTPSPEIINLALGTNLARWKADPATNQEYLTYGALESSKAMYYLALVAYHQPTNTAVTDRLVAQIRNVIAGGNEPTCRGTILGWTDNALAQSLVLAKRTTKVWEQLTPAEVDKCNWLMRALTVAGNYMQNFNNDPERCLLGVFEGRKTRAPNIQEGYVGIMIAAHHYFGGASAVNSMLAGFDYDDWLSTFATLGFTNIIYGWTYAHGNTPTGRATMKQLMEHGGTAKLGGNIVAPDGVRHPFTFAGYYGTPRPEIPYEPFAIYEALAERMYRGPVHNKSTSGAAYILNNRISPMTGLDGMCNELQGSDGSGERSSVRYTYDGWNNNILTYATLRALGLWGNTPAHRDIDRKIKTGSIDVLYKYKAGYRGRSNGEIKVHTEPSGTTLGYNFLKDIWINYLWTRKDLNLLELMSPTVTESFGAATLTSGFTNGQFTGEQGLVWHYTQARKGNGQQVKPSDNDLIALSASNNGNLRTTLTKPLKGLRFKVRARTAAGAPVATVRVNNTAVFTYSSFESTEVEVVHVTNISALTGQELMIDNTGTAELLIDDVELEEAPIFILQRNGNSGSTVKTQLRPHFKLVNQTSAAVPYKELTIKYWFTSENHSELESFVDVAGMGPENVLTQSYALSPDRQGADRYMEYSFAPEADSLPANNNSGAIQTRTRKINLTSFDEADDYSYTVNTGFVETTKVTVYRNGQLIWGHEPGPSGARLAVSQKEEVYAGDWFLYPNPANDEVRFGGEDSKHRLTVTIWDMSGRMAVQSYTYLHQPVSIRDLPAGLYQVEVQDGQTTRRFKLIKP